MHACSGDVPPRDRGRAPRVGGRRSCAPTCRRPAPGRAGRGRPARARHPGRGAEAAARLDRRAAGPLPGPCRPRRRSARRRLPGSLRASAARPCRWCSAPRPRPDRRAGAGRDRGRRHRQGPGAAGGRPGRALGRALDARRPAAAALAAAPPERPAQPAPPRQGRLPGRARAAARRRRRGNGVGPARLRVAFPDAGSFAPRAGAGAVAAPTSRRADRIGAAYAAAGAMAEAAPPVGGPGRRRLRSPAAAATRARSPTARARACARTSPPPSTGWPRRGAPAGVALVVNSGFRSDAEQAALFAANPDPRWVAPPGQLAAPLRHRARPRPARRLRLAGGQRAPLRLRPALLLGGLALRLRRGPAALLGGGRRGRADRAADGRTRRARRACRRSSRRASGRPDRAPPRRWNVSAALLAAQLMAESNFNPYRGLAGRRPGDRPVHARRPPPPTASHDPFDPAAAIDAQAHLMSDLLRQFGSSRSPSPPTTPGRRRSPPATASPRSRRPSAYVARILGLLGGAGAIVLAAAARGAAGRVGPVAADGAER